MKKRRICNLASSVLTLVAVLLMFSIVGGLDTDKLTIKNAIMLALVDFNFYGIALVLSAKGGQDDSEMH